MVFGLTACDGPSRPVPVASVNITPVNESVIVGTTRQLEARALDANGGRLTGRAIQWKTLTAAVAAVSSDGLVTGIAPGIAAIEAASEGVTVTANITVVPVPVASIEIAPSNVSLFVGTNQVLTATLRDAQGNVLTNRSVVWRSNTPTVAAISSGGTISALAAGSAIIEATSEGVSRQLDVTVMAVPIATLTVTLPSPSMTVGAQQLATATARDASGTVLPGRIISWQTTSSAIATISNTGLITAVATGAVSVIATSEDVTGVVPLIVLSDVPTIESITPATLIPGTVATIAVGGFDASTGATAVTIGGTVAAITGVSPTQLMVTVPCVLAGTVDVRLTNAAIAPIVRTQPLVTPSLVVPIGEAVIFGSGAASTCNELAPTGGPARYLMTVFSASTNQNQVSTFELVGTTPGAAASIVAAPTPLVELAPTTSSPADETIARHEQAHFAMLERNRRDYAQLMARSRPSARVARRAFAAEVAPGDMRSVFFTFNGGCSDVSRVVRARAIRVGTRAIIWEDSANVLQSGGNTDLAGYYDRIGQIYDQEQHASIARSFGDPLRRDAETDNDGKVHMVFTERLNGTGAAAYVTACDQFTSDVAPGSNFGQYFYGFVPTVATPNINSSSSPDGWFYFMARTVVHEVKHIASMSARVANNAPSFEQSWLEEGTARHAEEMWVRESLHRVDWKANTGFGSPATNGVYCDFHPSDATCNAGDPLHRPGYGMRRQFNEIRDKLVQPWNWSPFGDATGQSGAVFYNTTWSLVRYAADRYSTADTAFLRTLTNSSLVGVANLTAAAGVSLDRLLGGWGLALYADDYPGLSAPSPDIQFPTWNLRSIYGGLHDSPNWTGRWNTPYPIQPTALAFGNFITQLPLIRGGAHAFYELSGTFTAPQLLHVRGNSATPANAALRFAITRLQ